MDSNDFEVDDEDESCSAREDGIHCDCWFDGDACCACGKPELTNEKRREYGMDEK